MKDHSIERSIARLFMVGFSGVEAGEELLLLIDEHGFTSFILFERNLKDREALRSMIKDAGDHGEKLGLQGLLFAADEEGGLISPLGRAVGRLPSAMGLAAGGSEQRARQAASVAAIALRETGLNLVLAPVLDVNDEPGNPVIGTRSFGDDPKLVASMGTAVIEGYHSARLACCVKHFPGHGSTTEDSHKCLPTVESTADRLQLKELSPFRAAFVKGVEAVMTAHVAYPGLDGEDLRPATLSPEIITGLLREKMGFEGTVISDSMEMMGLSGHMPAPEACVKALRSGVDLFICVDSVMALECARRVRRAYERGDIEDGVVERAFRNVDRLKRASRGVAHETPETAFAGVSTEREIMLSECYTASLTLLGDSAHRLKERLSSVKGGALLLPEGLPGYEDTDIAFATSTLSNLGVRQRWRVVSYPFDPEDAEIDTTVNSVKEIDGVVFCGLSRGPTPQGQRRLFETMARRCNILAAVSLLDPYEAISGFPEDLPRIATYGCWPECLAALLDLLFGVGSAPGVLPVRGS